MPTSTEESLKLSYSLHGLQQATLRLDFAHWHRGEDAFIAAAEAVSWAATLDRLLEARGSQYKGLRGQSDYGKSVIGMRFVRNHIHHESTMLDFVRLQSVVGNSVLGFRAGWLWAPLDELEPHLDPEHSSGKGLYSSHLDGRVVLHTLLDANRWFLAVTPPIPPLPPDPTGADREQFRLPERWPPVDGDRRE